MDFVNRRRAIDNRDAASSRIIAMIVEKELR